MKLNKKIIELAIAGVTTIAPVVSQSAIALAAEANSNPTSTTSSNKVADNGQKSDAGQKNDVKTPDNSETSKDDSKKDDTKADATKNDEKPKQDDNKIAEPKLKPIKVNAKWSKAHKRANRYYNTAVKKGAKLSNLKRLNLYKDTLKHFTNNKASYTKKYRDNLTAEINWLAPVVEKEQQGKIVNPLPDVPTDHPADSKRAVSNQGKKSVANAKKAAKNDKNNIKKNVKKVAKKAETK